MRKETLISIGKTAKILGVSIDTLRRWGKNGKLIPIVSPKGHRKYVLEEIEALVPHESIFFEAFRWASAEDGAEPKKEFYCQTNADLQYRVKKLENRLSEMKDMQEIYSLVTVVAGEIGNNSFDHNLGNWPDIPGIFFGWDLGKRQIVLADRGQGIFKTLQRVKPELKNDAEALDTAFTEFITGRAPEKRGNGLKLVRKIVPLAHIDLFFQTGNSTLHLTEKDNALNIGKAEKSLRGCLALIKF
jgi:DNA-binding transcriptional MerR regulator